MRLLTRDGDQVCWYNDDIRAAACVVLAKIPIAMSKCKRGDTAKQAAADRWSVSENATTLTTNLYQISGLRRSTTTDLPTI
jgi:hypothetical protein